MNMHQENLLNKIRANIRESRDILDYLRFRIDDPLTEEEREKLNMCHLKICEANDQI